MDVWIKTSNNWRKEYSETGKEYAGREDVMFDPDLSQVTGIPPHHWKADPETSAMVPMSISEMHEVQRHHEKHGVDNDTRIRGVVEVTETKESKQSSLVRKLLPWVFAASAFGAAAYVALKAFGG